MPCGCPNRVRGVLLVAATCRAQFLAALIAALGAPTGAILVEIPAALAADLATLTQALDDPDPDVQSLVQALARDTMLVVPSYLGVSLSIAAGVDTDFSFTVLAHTASQKDVRTSLQLPLARISDSTALGTLTFYAASPGAFVDLAADIGWALRLDPGVLLLDTHLLVPATGAESGLAAISAINQAIGVLIDRGSDPAEASRELDRRGRRAGTTRHEAATHLLAAVQRDPAIVRP